jgi:uncharacterized protein (DUF58 family)
LVLYDGIDTKTFKPQNNHKNLMAILNAISETSLKILNSEATLDEADINVPLKFLRYGVKSRAMVFILSDFKNVTEEALKSIVALTKRCRVYCINIYDFIEEVPPPSGEYMSQYNQDRIVFDSTSDVFKRTYFYYFQDKRKTMENFCKRFGCQYLNIRTDKPLYKQLKIL